MSNLFILIKYKNFVPDRIIQKISPHATLYNFLWIGKNSIKNYHMYQCRGPLKYIKLFKNKVIYILNNANVHYSIITGNKGYLNKPSENDFTICQERIIHITTINNKNLKKEKVKINKIYLCKIINNLQKTTYGYYLPILLSSNIKEQPVKIKYDVFITFDNDNTIIYGENKYAIRNTKNWLKRLSKLYEKYIYTLGHLKRRFLIN